MGPLLNVLADVFGPSETRHAKSVLRRQAEGNPKKAPKSDAKPVRRSSRDAE